ncbi:tetraspanin-18B-like [Littorina saxatilis]|uniref:Tetraspanin n=1 Tax=Littorina saxatilis TaxID=31220 RepID=A0AAN9G1H2_9CAEN
MTESIIEMCESSKGCVKCVILVINTFLLIVGAASMGTGIWLLTSESSLFYRYHDVIAESDVNAALLKDGVIAMLAGGLAILMFASIGIVAAVTSSTGLLAMYTVLLSALMAVEVAPVILAVVFRADWMSKIDKEVLAEFRDRYGDDNSDESSREFTSAFNALQSDFDCCGWFNGSDYDIQAPQKWNNTKMMVPESCCNAHNQTSRDSCVTEPMTSELYNSIGCRDALTNLLTTYEYVVISLGGVILGLELLMVIGTVTLLSISVGNKYDLS